MRRRAAQTLFLLVSFLVFSVWPQRSDAQETLSVLRITPAGESVPPGMQLVIEFNKDMVPLGRMDRKAEELPVSITPELRCQWRWLNTKTLACQLGEGEGMKPATRYTVTVRPGLQSLDGAALPRELEHHFTTSRPEVAVSFFRTWRSPNHPEQMVVFTQKVDPQSVAKHLYLLPHGGNRVPLSVTEAERYEGRGFHITPHQPLPADRQIELHVEPGIRSLEGPEPGNESRVITSFQTFAPFRFLGVRCRDLRDAQVTISADAAESVGERCDPLARVYLLFNAPVLKESVKKGLTVTPDIAGGRTDYDPWESVYSYSRLDWPHMANSFYEVPLPEMLQAETRYSLAGAAIEDEFGRTLTQPIALSFETSARRPSFVLLHPMAVLEQGIDSEMPAVVTNLTGIELRYDRITDDGVSTGLQRSLAPYAARNVAYPFPLGVREALGGRSGAIKGHYLTVPPATSHDSSFFFAEVTPFHVHVKLGHLSSLVWVTELASGKPVADADVRIYPEGTSFTQNPEVLASAKTDAHGIAMLPGLAAIDPEQKIFGPEHIWSRELERHLMVRVDSAGELALVPLVYDFYQYPSGSAGQYIPFYMKKRYGHLKSWGVTPQGIYKAGDTVHYKIYVRDQSDTTLVPAPVEKYNLKVYDPLDVVVHQEGDIRLSEFGAFSGEFTVPRNGAVGWYRFVIGADFTEENWTPIEVLISDFTPSPFKVTGILDRPHYRLNDTVTVKTEARLHAGGPYSTAPARVTARLYSETIRPTDPKFAQFSFTGPESRGSAHVAEFQAPLDQNGDLSNSFPLHALPIEYGSLKVETAVQDDRGKYIAGIVQSRFTGRDRYVGLFQEGWVLDAGKLAKVEALVVDEQGAVAPGTDIVVLVEHEEVVAARMKGPGNAYLTRYERKWTPVAECTVRSQTEPVPCWFMPNQAGSYRYRASINDTQGRPHVATLQRWAVGRGAVLWPSEEGNTLELVPESAELKVGDTARVLVRNPFPGAQALVSLERYGVLESWVQTLEGSTPIIELPIKPDYLPGVYLSVVVMSPRVDKPMDGALVDLGKPAFKMGYLALPIQDDAKMLRVTAKARKDSYKPRETITVDLHAQSKDGAAPPMEFAVAVLDEAVLDLLLKGRDYFDPYQSFYSFDELDLLNYNLIKQLVGRIKFEKKGANPGGAGAALGQKMRSMIKFVSYWNPSLAADGEGKATIEFEAPDNLTGWRVLAIATTKDDLMGLGDGRYVVNQATEIRPALPNQVLEGDSFEAGFTVMNRTDKERTLTVTLRAEGPLAAPVVHEEQITAPPFERRLVRAPITTAGDGLVSLSVSAGDSSDQDGLVAAVPVRRRLSKEVAAVYGTLADTQVSTPIAVPSDARGDAGDISIMVSPTVIGNLTASFEYLKEYPYICWEQRLTKAVAAAQYLALRGYLPESFEWLEAEQLVQDTLKDAASHQGPGGGMAYYTPREEYEDPYLSAYTAIAFVWLKDAGHEIPAPVAERLAGYLRRLLEQNVVPSYYTPGMEATVRAVALAALAGRGELSVEELRRYEPHLPQMSLFGKAHFARAAAGVQGADAILAKVQQQLRASAVESAGTITFNEAVDTFDEVYSRILSSPLRSNCAVLSVLLAAPSGSQPDVDLAFKVTRSITQARGERARWENTQENIFCLNALREYAARFEQVEPKLRIEAAVGGELLGSGMLEAVTAPALQFTRPLAASDPGATLDAVLRPEGSGRAYYTTRLTYMPKELRSEPLNAGIEIRREYSVERDGTFQVLAAPLRLQRGELVRVDLFVSIPTARAFVVVEDPIPGGFEPVNRDLATASSIDANKASGYPSGSYWYRHDDWSEFGYSRWSFYHQELRHEAARFYSEYLPPGRYSLSYVAQVVAPGEFVALPPHAEAMYDPDIFGKGTPVKVEVGAPQ